MFLICQQANLQIKFETNVVEDVFQQQIWKIVAEPIFSSLKRQIALAPSSGYFTLISACASAVCRLLFFRGISWKFIEANYCNVRVNSTNFFYQLINWICFSLAFHLAVLGI